MPKSNNSGFIHFIPLLLIAVAVLVISFADFKSMFKTDLSNQSVLSESSDSEEEDKNEDEGDEDESKDVEDNNNDSDKNESSQKPTEQESDDSTDEDEDEDNDENETEDEVDDEDEADEDLEEDLENELEIENENNSKLKIKIKSNGNEFEFESEGENVNVQSNFPLSVNPETNELTVTTPNGEKVVTILPDEAINNMLDNEKLTLVTATSISEDENGELEYQIEGQDEEKLLGVFNIKIHKIFTISATTGQETSSQMDLLNKILDFLSV